MLPSHKKITYSSTNTCTITLIWYISFLISLPGQQQQVQRTIATADSPLSRGVVWEFEGDAPHNWTSYDWDTMHIIEETFTRRNNSPNTAATLDLRYYPFPQPYIINFGFMTQVCCYLLTGFVLRFFRSSGTPKIAVKFSILTEVSHIIPHFKAYLLCHMFPSQFCYFCHHFWIANWLKSRGQRSQIQQKVYDLWH